MEIWKFSPRGRCSEWYLNGLWCRDLAVEKCFDFFLHYVYRIQIEVREH